jgi:hypothetical protein
MGTMVSPQQWASAGRLDATVEANSGARELATPLDLARHLHDTVAQRLAAVSYLLACDEPLTEATKSACRAEVDAALDELRDALHGVGSNVPPPQKSPVEELDGLRAVCPGAHLDVDLGGLLEGPEAELARTFLAEALRNVRKHARPATVLATAETGEGVRILKVVNDGVRPRAGSSCGAGTRLLQLEASLLGALVESSELRPGWWQQRLILPLAA